MGGVLSIASSLLSGFGQVTAVICEKAQSMTQADPMNKSRRDSVHGGPKVTCL